MTSQVIWITGHSGVGKSTLCRGLATILNCDCILTGEFIRSTYPQNYIVSDNEVLQFINDRLLQKQTNLVLIDDFPYNKNQFMV